MKNEEFLLDTNHISPLVTLNKIGDRPHLFLKQPLTIKILK